MSEESILKRLLESARSAHLEHLAQGSSIEDVARCVCAFLNSGGGTVLLQAESFEQAKARLKGDLEFDLRSGIQPAALWTAVAEKTPDGGYCIIDVPAGRDKPYTADGRIYLRTGAKTVEATSDEIHDVVETGYLEVERWERRPLSSDAFDRLDRNMILETAVIGREKRNYRFTDPEKPEAILKDLALLRQGAVTNAAEVLFGLQPAIQFPQVRARVTVYAADKGGDFVDSRTFEQCVFRTLDEVLGMIRQHTPVASSFPSGLLREDRPAYPERAIREGLVNAFAHREYADFVGGVSVDLYPERLVIWNSGQLPPGMKIGDLRREHPSMPRNPDIAQVFWLRAYMERVGRGTQNIVAWCKEAGLAEPKWKADENGVTLTFFARSLDTTIKLNLRQEQLLSVLKAGDAITLPDYAERYFVSQRQGRRDLTTLVDVEWLHREGDGPSTRFVRTSKKPPDPPKPGQTRPK